MVQVPVERIEYVEIPRPVEKIVEIEIIVENNSKQVEYVDKSVIEYVDKIVEIPVEKI